MDATLQAEMAILEHLLKVAKANLNRVARGQQSYQRRGIKGRMGRLGRCGESVDAIERASGEDI